ncbi:glycosyltransferase family 4 protein [Nibrella saemangeumensis]|uniref:Glycosyltransferase family 4 protein n=1 Tax=Nibrella saemangeumensis TaxID=1084526 RepID=A0ABP8MZN1_9BACT
MTLTAYVFLTTLFFGIELAYLRLASRLGIFDKPNERSSHTGEPVRGGGILFWFAALCAFVYSGLAYPFFFAGLTLVTLLSFLDDLYTLPNRYRLLGQFLGVWLMLWQTGIWPAEGWVYIPVLVVGVGILNAYNFMDGINGITALYSLITVGTLWYLQGEQGNQSLYGFTMIGLLVFTWFNARRKALCFAGDVGSISMALLILFLLYTAIIARQNYLLILLLGVYGVDSVLTILHRLWLGQNIFQAHRLHLFQLLVHRLRWPHLRVSALYAGVQVLINALVIWALTEPVAIQIAVAAAILGLLASLYIGVKRRLMR